MFNGFWTTIIATEVVYFITIMGEYISVSTAFKMNQRLAKASDRIPLSDEIFNKERLGYLLEWFFGAIVILGMGYFLAMNNVIGWTIYILGMLVGFFVRNILYSTIANKYYQKKVTKYQESIMNNQAFPHKSEFENTEYGSSQQKNF